MKFNQSEVALEPVPDGLTVNAVEPLMPFCTAPIFTLPAFTPVTNPPGVIVATVVSDELQVAVFVRSFVLLSLYVPWAANCCWLATVTEDVAGVTAIETNVGVRLVGGVELLLPHPIENIVATVAARNMTWETSKL